MNEAFINERLEGEDADKKVWNRLNYSRDGIIEASAGTGKTYTLQSIVLKLLHDKVVDSVKNILLVTFTEKAAGELRDRIRKILVEADCLPDDFDEVNICTIHSFCRELLTEYAFENGVPMKTDVGGSDDELIHRAVRTSLLASEWEGDCFLQAMSEAGFDSVEKLILLVKKQFDKKPLEVPQSKSGKITKTVRKAQAQASLVKPLVDFAKKEFMRLKAESSKMTFDDMVAEASRVIGEQDDDSELLKSIRRKYRIALVDEFQDTDAKQWNIFRKIFSSAVNTVEDAAPKPKQGFLLVVGDPKQAIYSFRGADVGMYLAAKEHVTDSSKGGPSLQSLDTTFRSSPDLVKAFNAMFRQGGGWFEGMSSDNGSIEYENDVNPPPDSTEKFHGFKPCEGFGPAVTLLESLPKQLDNPSSAGAGYGNKSLCLPVFIHNAATEMKRLRGLTPAYRTVDAKTNESQDHQFAYRDMCVLVRGKGEAATVKRILAEHGIPYAYYKEQGLYDSEEAESVLALFDYLADSGRRGRLEAVLLTPICDVPLAQLAARLDSRDAEFSRTTDRWKELAAKREWGKLFESVLNDTCLAYPVVGDFEYDRRMSAIRQIFDKLLAQCGASARSISEFADELRSWRKNDQAAEENGMLRQRESEADCVQIMTMHVSKGLEFKVVFIAYGFGAMASQAEKDEKPAAMQEERRLLYVALTRAEYKLYLPWSKWVVHRRLSKNKKGEITSDIEEIGIGSVGSALLIQSDEANNKGFLAKGILAYYGRGENTTPAEAAAEKTEAEKAAAMKAAAKKAADEVKGGYSPESLGQTSASNGVGAVNGVSVAITEYEEPGYLGHLKLQWDSYSSIGHHSSATKMVLDKENREDENPMDGQNPQQDKRIETLLPRGATSGDVFHEIMETLCGNDDTDDAPGFVSIGRGTLDKLQDGFGAEEETPFVQLVRRIMRKHSIGNREKNGDSTERTLARMVWHALNTPITVGAKTFVLKDIDAGNRRAEMEFVIDEKSLLGDALPKLAGHERDGLFNGKIDLLVRPDGVNDPVFVIDWKTNSLDSFDDAKVAEAMVAAGYDLQYKLYSLAVRQWLGEGKLGGIAYLFVRGGEVSNGQSGVYAKPVSAQFFDDCLASVKEALPNGRKNEDVKENDDGNK